MLPKQWDRVHFAKIREQVIKAAEQDKPKKDVQVKESAVPSSKEEPAFDMKLPGMKTPPKAASEEKPKVLI